MEDTVTLSIPITGGRFAVLQIPDPITARDIEFLGKYVSLWKEAFAVPEPKFETVQLELKQAEPKLESVQAELKPQTVQAGPKNEAPERPKLRSLGGDSKIPKFRKGKAVWRANEADQLINIIGYAGEKDGKHFVQIEGSSTGVPLNEVWYE